MNSTVHVLPSSMVVNLSIVPFASVRFISLTLKFTTSLNLKVTIGLSPLLRFPSLISILASGASVSATASLNEVASFPARSCMIEGKSPDVSVYDTVTPAVDQSNVSPLAFLGISKYKNT